MFACQVSYNQVEALKGQCIGFEDVLRYYC